MSILEETKLAKANIDNIYVLAMQDKQYGAAVEAIMAWRSLGQSIDKYEKAEEQFNAVQAKQDETKVEFDKADVNSKK